MARYIDVDKLIKDVLTSWGKDNHASVAASYVHSQEHRHLMSIIEKQPTANVAPIADTVKKMQERFEERLDISVCGYSTEEVKSTCFETLDQIAKEMLEGER